MTEYYNKESEREWRRLVSDPYHSLGFLVTMHYIRKYFPQVVKFWTPVVARDVIQLNFAGQVTKWFSWIFRLNLSLLQKINSSQNQRPFVTGC
jgi:hypothetical protein